MSIAGLLPVEFIHLAHSQRLHLRQRHWTKLNCLTQDYCLFGGKVDYVTPLAHLQDLPQLNWRRLILSRHHYQFVETVQLLRWTEGIFAFCLTSSFYNNTHSRTIKWLLVVKQSVSSTLSLQLSHKCEKKRMGPFNIVLLIVAGPPLWSSCQSFWLQIQRSRVRSPTPPDFLSSTGSGTGSTQPREVKLRSYLNKKIAAPGSENRD